MINTNNKRFDNISIAQLHDIILKNAQIKLLDYTKTALLKHNRSEKVRFGFHNQHFFIGNDVLVSDFLCDLDNPHLKQSDDQNHITATSKQMLNNYFNNFDISDLIIIAGRFAGFCDKDVLNSVLIANYLDICFNMTASNKEVANYINNNCLDAFSAYWLNHFKTIVQKSQENCKYLEIVIQPYITRVDASTIVIVFIRKIANLITSQHPDYICQNLVTAINAQMTNKMHFRVNLPFKYLESYLLLDDELSLIPVNCQIITTNDEKYLVELLIGDLTSLTNRFTSEQVDKLIKAGLTLDVNGHQADIKDMISGFKKLPQAKMIPKYIAWLQKTFLV